MVCVLGDRGDRSPVLSAGRIFVAGAGDFLVYAAAFALLSDFTANRRKKQEEIFSATTALNGRGKRQFGREIKRAGEESFFFQRTGLGRTPSKSE